MTILMILQKYVLGMAGKRVFLLNYKYVFVRMTCKI